LLFKNGSLRENINNKIRKEEDIDNDQVEKWSNQLILGLNFLHTNNIIHKDIKPEFV
jgi:serine/threonine protein kinase